MQLDLLTQAPPPKPAPVLPNAPQRQESRSQVKIKKPRKLKTCEVDALIDEARRIVAAYNDAALACNRRRMVGLYAMFEDLAAELNGGSCGIYDEMERILRKIAAPDGSAPLHGQAGRFVLRIAGARCAVTYKGMCRISPVDVEPLDFGKPWLASGGMILLSHMGSISMNYRRPGDDVPAFVERAIIANLDVQNADEITLTEMRYRWRRYSTAGGSQEFDQPIVRPIRSWHPDWQPGGFWHGLATGIKA